MLAEATASLTQIQVPDDAGHRLPDQADGLVCTPLRFVGEQAPCLEVVVPCQSLFWLRQHFYIQPAELTPLLASSSIWFKKYETIWRNGVTVVFYIMEESDRPIIFIL